MDKLDLGQFYGTEKWFRHNFYRNILHTEGVQYLADHTNSFWLIDEIAGIYSKYYNENNYFQVFKLEVNLEKQTAVLTVTNGNEEPVTTKKIKYTDFPLDEIVLWCVDHVIMLPTEY